MSEIAQYINYIFTKVTWLCWVVMLFVLNRREILNSSLHRRTKLRRKVLIGVQMRSKVVTMFWTIAGIITFLKLTLFPSYHSTDFEVHRNWLAITYSLPYKDWYYEKTSQWTLDYPPLFAWFEKLLAQAAYYFDPAMLRISNLEYASPATVLFQRLSVVCTDFLYIYAVYEFVTQCLKRSQKVKNSLLSPELGLAILLMGNAGLLIVDHIHFQYNGFLYGILLLSINKMMQERYLYAAFLFAVLLNFKHIYLYMAPAYFICLLRSFCFSSNKDGRVKWSSFSVVRVLILGVIVIDVFLVSFGPFLVTNQLPQLISRLFPFKRGLCHAYWAPNIWALYNVLDKVLTVVGVRLGLLTAENIHAATMTGGLVQEFHYTVLPNITPFMTLCCTVLAILPAVVHTWFYPQRLHGFLRCLTLCAWGAYMFGWHVHEKAILMVIIPITLLAFEKKKDAQIFLLISSIGHCSLFPLIFTQPETPIKYVIVLLYAVLAFIFMSDLHSKSRSHYQLPLLSLLETLYILGFVFLELYNNIIHGFLKLDKKLPFLPLLLTSVYCAGGVLYAWLKFYWIHLTDRTVVIKPGKTD